MTTDVTATIRRVLANPVVLCDKCRLHGADNDVVVCESPGNCHDLADHANAAQELARECERLRAERAHLLRAWENGEDSVLAAAARSVVATLMAEVERLRERVAVLEEALRPLATASMVSSVRPVYVIGARFGAPYDQRAAEAMVQAARAALEGKP